ncbi:Alanine--tRNA ligase [Hondaea fermentalgiana]|uniref:Alanine--tRNA ligase n=1 Tax=Hondaea fermentalgiana TaxID=2315210 RepID=A0A2R5GAG5_9STRA|nr:Alanine--tRNA ligase [Hondaea fermentalgiana]|eukprot:GBG27289.1 Alanine--tRNA ligase [Hondaea fermentalgiana]
MVPFKEVFLGRDQRPYTRATSCQKCVRAGGKHNDLDNVGYTARHHTFFEMLGNFSFGDYFKEEAIVKAWNFVRNDLDLPAHRLSITVFHEDDESAELWRKILPPEAGPITRLGKEDNFWSMGDGKGVPCGPCSEIFFDTGDTEAADDDRYLEIWNLVFMQFQADGNGGLDALPRPCVDTGMGLERVCSVLQGVPTNYETDLLAPLVQQAAAIVPVKDHPNATVFAKIAADHVRAAAFLIADGVVPSNVGRGYVLRRILRRAVGFGHSVGLREPFLAALLPTLEATFAASNQYPELTERRGAIASVVQAEETNFFQTLDQGMDFLEKHLQRASAGQIVDGAFAFKMYDTFGFPVDITTRVAQDRGLQVDLDSFRVHMEAQRARSSANASWASDSAFGMRDPTEEVRAWAGQGVQAHFSGHECTQEAHAHVLAKAPGAQPGTTWVSISPCPLYPEGGGQQSDRGTLSCAQGNDFPVLHVCKPFEDGLAVLVEGSPENLPPVGSALSAVVDARSRRGAAAHHTATHLLQAALRAELGEHVVQAGSLVTSDRLRFDFTHSAPLSTDQIRRIEACVNGFAEQAIDVQTQTVSLEEAKKMDVLMHFGEKYGQEVRVVRVAGEADPNMPVTHSAELCGGTHVTNTAVLHPFKIVAQSSVAAGTRRVEAVVGAAARVWMQERVDTLENIATELKADVRPEAVQAAIRKLCETQQRQKADIKALQKRILEASAANGGASSENGNAPSKATSETVAVHEIPDLVPDDLKQARKSLQTFLSTAVKADPNRLHVVVCGSKLVACSTQNPSLHAGDMLKRILATDGPLPGKGGGSPAFAQGQLSKDRTASPRDILQFVQSNQD